MNNMKIGFQFKKISKPKSVVIPTTSIRDDQDEERSQQLPDFITSIDDRKIQGSSSDRTDEPLVIPLIRINKYRFDDVKIQPDPDPIKEQSELVIEGIKEEPTEAAEKDDLLSKAKRELIQQAQRQTDDAANGSMAWQSLLINKLPDQYENNDRCDVSMRPEESRPEDYERIPVEAFGLGMLRGMGWTPGQAIGGINKAVTPIIEPQLRPRGLGLGADISLKKQLEPESKKSQTSAKDEQPVLRKGCHVRVLFGPHKDTYGTVESISDDLAYASIKTSIGGLTLNLPPETMRVITKKEYDTESKVINKNKYEEYKRREQTVRKTNDDEIIKHKRETYTEPTSEDIWIVPKIRAQIIDKKYKDGRYYKEKIVITSTDGSRCTGIITKKRKILKDISQSQLRTVIPSQSSSSYVMILRGRHKGKFARLDTIDWDLQTATINLSGYVGKPFSISLDDISEFDDSNNFIIDNKK